MTGTTASTCLLRYMLSQLPSCFQATGAAGVLSAIRPIPRGGMQEEHRFANPRRWPPTCAKQKLRNNKSWSPRLGRDQAQRTIRTEPLDARG